ncbi:variable surface protein [Plasmodium gonderi]|uniref:Variable surface protein n=1 Tax=Plasmodium gonderi TaxID=77519 RepID=A0A1Y1JNG0_PLAGO|nr:variable surface protein [Plasmodium gonderi]GAW84001.1 variable surface protein [Plasmodium gonderi]
MTHITVLTKKCTNTESYDENIVQLELEIDECHKKCEKKTETADKIQSQLLSNVEQPEAILPKKTNAQERNGEQIHKELSVKTGVSSQDQHDFQISSDTMGNGNHAYALPDNSVCNKIEHAESSTQHLSFSCHTPNSLLHTKATFSSVESGNESEIGLTDIPEKNLSEMHPPQKEPRENTDTSSISENVMHAVNESYNDKTLHEVEMSNEQSVHVIPSTPSLNNKESLCSNVICLMFLPLKVLEHILLAMHILTQIDENTIKNPQSIQNKIGMTAGNGKVNKMSQIHTANSETHPNKEQSGKDDHVHVVILHPSYELSKQN